MLSGAVPCYALTLTEAQGLLANIPLMCLERTGSSSQVEVLSDYAQPFQCELPALPGESASISLGLSLITTSTAQQRTNSQAELPPLWEFLTFFFTVKMKLL